MSDIVLFEHPLSSYAQKIKIALREKGVAFATRVPEGLGAAEADPVLAALGVGRVFVGHTVQASASQDPRGTMAYQVPSMSTARFDVLADVDVDGLGLREVPAVHGITTECEGHSVVKLDVGHSRSMDFMADMVDCALDREAAEAMLRQRGPQCVMAFHHQLTPVLLLRAKPALTARLLARPFLVHLIREIRAAASRAPQGTPGVHLMRTVLRRMALAGQSYSSDTMTVLQSLLSAPRRLQLLEEWRARHEDYTFAYEGQDIVAHRAPFHKN
jgi:hypothetical protein